MCRELWSSVSGTFIVDAECGKDMPEAFNESSRTITCVFDDGPVRVYVDYYKVGDALVVKVVRADTLE